LKTEKVGLAPQRVTVRALDGVRTTETGVENGVVKEPVADIATGIGSFGEENGLIRIESIGGDAAVNEAFGEGQGRGSDHGGEEGKAGSAGGPGIGEDLFGGGVAVGNGEVIGTGFVFKAIEQCRGGAVVAGAVGDAEGDIHGENDEVDLIGEGARGEKGKQGGEELCLKVISSPLDVSAGPGDTEEIFGRNLSALAIVIAEFAGIRTELIDDNDGIEAATTREGGGDERQEEERADRQRARHP